MNTILLQPTDVLFFRDGRPMEGALSGHGASWPLPTVTDAAIHAALHRSELESHTHHHDSNRGGDPKRKFGSLTHTGPFPVSPSDDWCFPRPLDLQANSSIPSVFPLAPNRIPSNWSCPSELIYPCLNNQLPSKEVLPPRWLSKSSYERYIRGESFDLRGRSDAEIFSEEHQVGIAIEPISGTTGHGETKGKIYSAHYLRMREGWRMGIIASTSEKKGDDRVDLLPMLLGKDNKICIGGQQRICTAICNPADKLSLPIGMTDGFRKLSNDRYAVKWVLLTPAVFPEITASADATSHPGGWLPGWISAQDAPEKKLEKRQVALRDESRTKRKDREPRDVWRRRIKELLPIRAHLVAAIVERPLVVTGWALANPDAGRQEGAKPTHLAVPAGAVYYFEADSEADAVALAAALNWHGSDLVTNTIRNRRSTLLGEKGFGIGVCGTWDFYSGPK